MRRTTVALGVAAVAVVGLVSSAVPGSATPSAAPGAATGAALAERTTPARLGAVLVGGNEVPGPGDNDGFGLADVRVAGGEVCWRVTVTGVDPITMAHVHAGPRGVAGPVVVPLDPYQQGCADAGRRLSRFLRQHPSQFYVNLHNEAFPAGAVRGQLAD